MRLLAIATSWIFLFASLGLSVNFHYCLGELESVQLAASSDYSCCPDGIALGCCSNDMFTPDVDQDFIKMSGSDVQMVYVTCCLPVWKFHYEIDEPTVFNANESILPDPPPRTDPPRYLITQSFLFYS